MYALDLYIDLFFVDAMSFQLIIYVIFILLYILYHYVWLLIVLFHLFFI